VAHGRAVLVALVAVSLAGCALGLFRPLPHEFVDSAATTPRPSPVSESANAVAAAVDVSTIEPDVRYLASPELRGRLRATDGNALARAHIVAGLKAAGLAPLFGGGFEQPTYPNGRGAGPHAVNVGGIYRALEPDARWIVLVAHYDHRGVVGGKIQAGADDNASSVALLLALGRSLGRVRPPLRRHVVLLFPDAEEPPDIRTERMGSSWFVLGAEADSSLVSLVADLAPAPRVEPIRLSLPMIEVMPYRPGSRFARSDYFGLREVGQRPFLFLTTGRTETYHTAADTPDTVDYERLGALSRWVARLAVHAADVDVELGWRDWRADPRADARSLLRLYGAIDKSERVAWLLRRALARDRRRVEQLLESWDRGVSPTPESYRALQLASIRAQAALWHPSGWWFALW